MAKSNQPVVYIVFRSNAGPTSTRFGGFITRLKKAGHMPHAEYKAIALEDMVCVIDEHNNATIYDQAGTPQLSDASFVYFKSWEAMPETASMVVSYLRAKGIPFEDAAVAHSGIHKPSQMWKLWSAGVAVIPTLSSYYVPSKEMVEKALGSGPYIVKPAKGEKGRGISKVQSYDEVVSVIESRPIDWIVQPYVLNDGDYRVMVYGYEVRGALYRQAAKGAVVNNTSQGATSTFIAPADVPEDVARQAVSAAQAVEHAVAGVDVMYDSGHPRVLEVNQGSQIATGHQVEKKMRAFGDFMSERISDRFGRRQPNNRLPVIGRYVHVNLPELGTKHVFAKVDTGAYQSAIHATNIHEVATQDGTKLEFTVLEGHSSTDTTKAKPSHALEYKKVVVRNSFGLKQIRYVIKTRISINGRMMKTGITLTDRKDMVAPLLLGRRFLRGRYLVNVEIGAKGAVEDE